MADTGQGNDGLYSLGEIRISATQADPYSEQTFSKKDLEVTGARSLEGALKLSPSLNVRYGADGTPRFDIRGFRTRQIKLLLNGIPLNSTYDGQFDPSLIPAFAIGRIDLNVGASSVLYGDGGIAGVINIKTRTGFQGLHAASKVEVGSRGYWLGNVQMGYGDADQSVFVGYGARDRNGFPMSSDFQSTLGSNAANYQNADTRLNSDSKRQNALFSYSRKLNSQLKFGLFVSGLRGNYGKPPTVYSNSTDVFAQRAKYERVDAQRGHTIQTGLDYTFNENWSSRLWLYENRLNEDTTDYDNANFNSYSNNQSDRMNEDSATRGVHFQLLHSLQATDGLLAFSADQRREQYDEKGVTCVIAAGGGGGGGGGGGAMSTCPPVAYTATAVDRTLRVQSLAAELTQPLPDQFKLVLGVGYHRLHKADQSNDSNRSAQLALSRPVSQHTTAYGSLARKVDTPTIRQLYDTNGGNSALGFERANHIEMGAKSQFKKLAINVALWRSNVRDFIERDANNNFVNLQKLQLQGLDATAHYRLSGQWTFNGGLGLLQAKDESANAVTDKLQYRPAYKFTAQAIWKIRPRWQLSGDFTRIGKQYYFSRQSNAVSGELSPFSLVNFKLEYSLDPDKTEAYLGVDNLLDKNYSTSYGFPQPGRFIYVGLNFSI